MRRRGPTVPASTDSRLFPLLTAAAAFLTYANVFNNGFLYGDDEELILRNAYLHGWRYLRALLTSQTRAGSGIASNFYRPLQMLLYFLAVQLFGVRPWPLQLLNVGLHAAAAAMVCILLRSLARLEDRAAAALSLLWALHPLHVEAVANINGTADPLALAAMLAAFYFFLNGRRAASLAFFAASLASKESAIMFPGLLLIHDWALAREKLTLKRHAPYWLTAGLYWAVRTAALRGSLTLDFYKQQNVFTEHLSYRVFTLLSVLGEGLKLLLWPSGLHAERSWPVYTGFWNAPVAGSAMVLAALLFLAMRRRALRPLASFGILWFFVSYAPMSNLFAKINALFWEHWFYVPSIGLVMVAAEFLSRATPAARKAVLWACVPVLALLASRTWAQTQVWRDPLSFDAAVLSYEPGSAKTWNNYAMALSSSGKPAQAITAYQRAIALSDTYPQTRYNLGNCYRDGGDLDAALREYRRALEIDPAFYFAHNAVADMLFRKGDRAGAVRELEGSLRLYPEQPNVIGALSRLKETGH